MVVSVVCYLVKTKLVCVLFTVGHDAIDGKRYKNVYKMEQKEPWQSVGNEEEDDETAPGVKIDSFPTFIFLWIPPAKIPAHQNTLYI